jgi:hypothetical protein
MYIYIIPTKLNKSVNRPWFDEICKHKRQEFHSARKIYNRFKSDTNRIRLSEASKDYEFAMNKISKIKLNNLEYIGIIKYTVFYKIFIGNIV